MTIPRRSNFLIVTGIDTGVGKTWVASALSRALQRHSLNVVAVKAVETGCSSGDHDHGDGSLLAAATGQESPRRALECFRESLAPALAAEREGRPLDFDDVLLKLEKLGESADQVVIEGTGGLLTPLAWDWCLVDVAQALEARAVVVANDRHGVVSQTLLTLGALELASVPVVAVVLTPPEVPDATTGTNAQTIQKLSGATCLIAIGPGTSLDRTAEELEDVAARVVDRRRWSRPEEVVEGG